MIAEALLGLLRLAHALSAAGWIGVSLVLAVETSSSRDVGRAADLLRPSIGVFVVTGVIMAMDRLSSAPLPPLYVILLGVKVSLGLWMFGLARGAAARTGASRSARARVILGLGIAVYALAMALRFVYEGVAREAGLPRFGGWSGYDLG